MDTSDIAALKGKILASGLSIAELVGAAWASASTFRGSDKRGGANGARVRLEPQKSWAANNPPQLAKVLKTLEAIQAGFNSVQTGGKQISLADLIVLGGVAAVEQAASNAGHAIKVPFTPGRSDASAEQTDAESFSVLEPIVDGFRNFAKAKFGIPDEVFLIDRAQLLTLTAPEMTALLGGLRAMRVTSDGSDLGMLTTKKDSLSNDFFVNLLSMDTEWKPVSNDALIFEGRCRKTGEVRWTASRVDLVFGHDSRLRALAEVYAANDGAKRLITDFVSAWDKVMMLDRFELAHR